MSAGNCVRAAIEFSFRGEDYAIDSLIDLDRCLIEVGESGEMPDFHLKLAQAGSIDTYSYLYEVLASHDIFFSEATGTAVACCKEGQFDWAAFAAAAGDGAEQALIEGIARAHGIDLDAAPAVAGALRAAYRAGREG